MFAAQLRSQLPSTFQDISDSGFSKADMSQKASKIAVEALVKAIHGGAAPSKTPLYSEADTETDFGWVTNFAGVDPQQT